MLDFASEAPRTRFSRTSETYFIAKLGESPSTHTLVNKAKKKGLEPEAPPFRVAFYLATQ
jgi:hypothetical protein